MTRGDLIERLSKYEWSDVEFKEARNAAPRSAYETVSAFANTSGGWLVFGVRDRGGTLDVVGVMQVDKVQNEFLSTLRSRQKINRAIGVAAEAVETDDMTLLVFHIPESPRDDKPVYLDGDIRRSYIRRGAGDERCTPEEIERFLRDASQDRCDGESLEVDAEEFFDPESVRCYRILDAAQLGQSTSDQVRGGAEGLVSDQPGRPDSRLVTPALTNLTDDQRTIIMLCEVPRKQADLMHKTGLSHRTFFRRKRLDPLLRAGMIRMTRPDEPNHPDQAYVVTEAALAILDEWRTEVGRKGDP